MRDHYVMSTKTNANFRNELLERTSQVTLEKRKIQDILITVNNCLMFRKYEKNFLANQNTTY